MDWKEITPVPDGAHDLRQIWNINCFNCHATNLVAGLRHRDQALQHDVDGDGHRLRGVSRSRARARRADGRVGEGSRAEAAYDNSSRTASSARPEDLLAALGRRGRSSTPAPTATATRPNVFTGFRGGDRYEDYALPFLISAPIPDNDLQGEFWPDGRPNRFNRPQAVMLSGCFKAGQSRARAVTSRTGRRIRFRSRSTSPRAATAICSARSATHGCDGATGARVRRATAEAARVHRRPAPVHVVPERGAANAHVPHAASRPAAAASAAT